MKILMTPTPAQLERLGRPGQDLPRWFAAPLVAATGGKASFCRSLPALLASGRSGKGPDPALVFNVGPLEAVLALYPLRTNLCSLYQWHPLEQLGPAKRFIYKRLLAKSKIVLAYSKITRRELEQRFPGVPVRWIGLFTDTDFFDPGKTRATPEPFMLCPGDHKRLEPVVSLLARELRMRVVRFSSGPEPAKYHARNPNPFVECLSGIPFSQVRNLYGSARLILNAVDDRFWPVGITTFCEALAMDKLVVTSGGHSCSGYEFGDGSRPYFTVHNCFDQEEWLRTTKLALGEAEPWAVGKSPRDLALHLCSFEATVAGWKSVLGIFNG